MAADSPFNIYDFTEKDIRNCGFRVTSKVYNDIKPHLYEVIDEIDLSVPLLKCHITEQPGQFFLSSDLTNNVYFDYFEELYGPHFCFIILRIAANSDGSMKDAAAKEYLQWIVENMEDQGVVFFFSFSCCCQLMTL